MSSFSTPETFRFRLFEAVFSAAQAVSLWASRKMTQEYTRYHV